MGKRSGSDGIVQTRGGIYNFFFFFRAMGKRSGSDGIVQTRGGIYKFFLFRAMGNGLVHMESPNHEGVFLF